VIGRVLHLAGAVAFALVVTGGGQALHRALEHAPSEHASPHSCADALAADTGATTTRHNEREPEPSKDDDCPVCVTLKSVDRACTAPDASLMIDAPALAGVERPRRVALAYAREWSAGPPRAPPVCA